MPAKRVLVSFGLLLIACSAHASVHFGVETGASVTSFRYGASDPNPLRWMPALRVFAEVPVLGISLAPTFRYDERIEIRNSTTPYTVDRLQVSERSFAGELVAQYRLPLGTRLAIGSGVSYLVRSRSSGTFDKSATPEQPPVYNYGGDELEHVGRTAAFFETGLGYERVLGRHRLRIDGWLDQDMTFANRTRDQVLNSERNISWTNTPMPSPRARTRSAELALGFLW